MKAQELYHAINFVQRVCPVLCDTEKMAETLDAVEKVNAVKQYFSDRVLRFPFCQDNRLEDVQGVSEALGIVLYVLEQYAKKGNQTAKAYLLKVTDVIHNSEGTLSVIAPEKAATTAIDSFIGYAPSHELYHALSFVERYTDIDCNTLRPLKQYNTNRILGMPHTNAWPVIPSLEMVPTRDKAVAVIYNALVFLAEQEASGKNFGDDGIAVRYKDNVTFMMKHHHLGDIPEFTPNAIALKQTLHGSPDNLYGKPLSHARTGNMVC